MMNAQIVMVMVLRLHRVAFSIFTEPYLITGGGPLNSTTSPMVVMYGSGVPENEANWAATMSIIRCGMQFPRHLGLPQSIRKHIEIV
ncbi:hypothetical protein [Enterobacter sp. RHBSTW-01064]|uniref:hypothetical protein n=1 Tax=Enterobacter sp. RHBSTW-01064 TaxID=2742679 RepID=UPI0020172746|nr:hypothetical protein [Enterobacter sp. RHBSTW-01064]